MKNLKIDKEAGLTLANVLVYLTIFTIVFGILISFIVWLYQSMVKFEALKSVKNNAQQVMESLAYEIREAESIYTPTSGDEQLSLETSHYPASGETFSFIDFFLCGAQVCLKKEEEEPIALTSGKVVVKSLYFKQLQGSEDAWSVQTGLVIYYPRASGEGEYQALIKATSTNALRNY